MNEGLAVDTLSVEAKYLDGHQSAATSVPNPLLLPRHGREGVELDQLILRVTRQIDSRSGKTNNARSRWSMCTGSVPAESLVPSIGNRFFFERRITRLARHRVVERFVGQLRVTVLG